MRRDGAQPWVWLMTVLIAGLIVYGSLYPFDFLVPADGVGPLQTFIDSIGRPPGRGNFVANVLLYLPFGFFFVLSFGPARRRAAVPLGVVCGAAMSLSVELVQYYDADRVASFSDFYTNTLGSLLGGLAALAAGSRFRLRLIGETIAQPIPSLLIIAWLGYRLYPYVPTIDLHKYWRVLQPIISMPSINWYDVFGQTAIWLALYALIEAIVGGWRFVWLAPLFAMAVLGGAVVIIDTTLRLAEPMGAGIALAAWLALTRLPVRVRVGVVGAVLCAFVIASQLEPFEFQAMARGFDWVPFHGLMQEEPKAAALSLLGKFFLYGCAIFLLGVAFGRRLPAAVAVAVLAFGTSWLEMYLPERSAEITDTVMALMIGLAFALLPSDREAPVRDAPSLTAQERQLRDWQRAQARARGVKIDG
jgi:VanZ family protein